jgi:hypothetical protein
LLFASERKKLHLRLLLSSTVGGAGLPMPPKQQSTTASLAQRTPFSQRETATTKMNSSSAEEPPLPLDLQHSAHLHHQLGSLPYKHPHAELFQRKTSVPKTHPKMRSGLLTLHSQLFPAPPSDKANPSPTPALPVWQPWQRPLHETPGFLAPQWIFFSPTGLLTGISSIWLGVAWTVVLVGRLLFMASLGLSLWIGLKQIPDWESRHCKYPNGRSKPCGSYPWHMWIFIIAAASAFGMAMLILLYEWMHVYRSYMNRARELLKAITLPATESAYRGAQQAIVFVLNTAATSRPHNSDPALWLAAFVESWIAGYFMRGLGVRWVPWMTLLIHIGIGGLICAVIYEEAMYQFWWRCYPRHTSIYDLNNGPCYTTVYPREKSWWIEILAIIGMELISQCIHFFTWLEAYETRKDPVRHMQRLTADKGVQAVLAEMLHSWLPELRDLSL